jgi:hypothetical protein
MRPYLLLLALIGFQPLSAQQWPAPITSGTRVQVKLPEAQYQIDAGRGQLIRGKVSVLAPDTLYLLVADSVGVLPIPRNMIRKLEYSRGVPDRFGSAVKRGLIAGVGSALVFALFNEVLDGQEWDTGDAALVGGVVGLVTGGVSGALWPRERWKRVGWE